MQIQSKFLIQIQQICIITNNAKSSTFRQIRQKLERNWVSQRLRKPSNTSGIPHFVTGGAGVKILCLVSKVLSETTAKIYYICCCSSTWLRLRATENSAYMQCTLGCICVATKEVEWDTRLSLYWYLDFCDDHPDNRETGCSNILLPKR